MTVLCYTHTQMYTCRVASLFCKSKSFPPLEMNLEFHLLWHCFVFQLVCSNIQCLALVLHLNNWRKEQNTYNKLTNYMQPDVKGSSSHDYCIYDMYLTNGLRNLKIRYGVDLIVKCDYEAWLMKFWIGMKTGPCILESVQLICSCVLLSQWALHVKDALTHEAKKTP